MDPCHSAREWQSCDLNVGRSGSKALPCLGGRGLEVATASCHVLRLLKEVLFSGLGGTGKSRFGSFQGTGLDPVRSEEKGPRGHRWGWG